MSKDPMSIRQKRDDWCVPAVTQFLGAQSALYDLEQEAYIAEAQKQGMSGGYFGDAKKVLNALFPDVDVEHVGSKDFEEWKTKVSAAVAAGDHMAVSIANPPVLNPVTKNFEQRWHMRVVLDCNEEGMRVFDPAEGERFIRWDYVRAQRTHHEGGEDMLLVHEPGKKQPEDSEQ